jgi:glucose repression mediator protein
VSSTSQINQYKDALDAYTRAIRLNPYISEVWFDLGSLYESCNRQLQDAVDAYLRAKELDPSNTVVVERLEILRRYEEDPSIIIPPAPAPRDVHPTAYSGPTNRNEPPPPMRTSPPGTGSFDTLRGRAMSRPGSSSGRYRNGSLGPPVDRSRGQGDIALADARDRDRAYTQNGRDRPGAEMHHGSIHSVYLNAPSNQQPLPPVMHGQPGQPQGPPPPSSSHRRHGHGSTRRTSPQRSVSPAGPPGPSGYGRGPTRGGSPLPSVTGLGLHGPPHSQVSHPSSSAAGGHYNSYAPPTSRYNNGLDRPRSSGSSARGGTYGAGIPPSGPPATPGGDRNDMAWERDGRPYAHPPQDPRDFIERDRDVRDQRIRVKEEPREPREQRGVRTGPSLPPPTPQHVNGAPRHYVHERRPSDDYEMRPPPPPQTSGHGYPPHDWEARSSSRGAGARSPMPPPQRYDSGNRRYDPLQEDRAPPNRYPSPPPNYQPGHHSPGVHYDDRDVHRGRQGPPSMHHEPPQAVQLTPQDQQPQNDRRRRGRQTGNERVETTSQNGKDGTPAPKRRGRTKKDQPTPTPTPAQPPQTSASGTTSSSPTGYRGADSYDARARESQQYPAPRYPDSDRHGHAEPAAPPRSMFGSRGPLDEDYDTHGAADALMGLSGTRKPPSTASQPPPPGSKPVSRRDSGAREHTPTPPGGSQVLRKRRRSGSNGSVYEVPPRAAMEPAERMEPERKKPRLDDESIGPVPGQANGASGARTFLPNIRTRVGSMDDVLMPDDSKKESSPKHSAPNSAAGTEAAPAPASQNGRASSPMVVDVPRIDSPTRTSPNGTPSHTKKSPEQDRPRASMERATSSPKARREGSDGATTSTNGKPQSSGGPLVAHSPSTTSRSGSVAASNSGAALTAA